MFGNLFDSSSKLFSVGSVEINSLNLLLVSAAVVLGVQLLLCFTVKNRFVRLAPMFLLFAAAVVSFILSACINGWDGFGYLFFAFLFAILTTVCGLGVFAWRMIQNRK